MKIFSPTEAKAAAEERADKDLRRASTIADTTKELLEMKAQTEREFAETLERQKKEAAAFHEEQLAKKKELEREVERLEKRRKEALMPLLIKEEDIHSVQEALHARELVVARKETEQEEESRALMRRLDEVSSKEQELSEREARTKRIEQGAEFQKNQVAADARRLGIQLADFQKMVEDKEIAFAYRQSELDAQAKLQQEKEQLFIQREKEIAAGKRLLEDQRSLLAKGFEELRREQQKHGGHLKS
ncbi:MAG: hypothetical protein KGL39_30215 [Patescibacteria group bacterium]|nr:hypothetical protein [Patescibacteria group bacterium]